ncbi:hypothetical protein C8R44DRAFT_751530 [Mycena epipterygia]|nr:hypothetical protein C8R44DRAFT_751530 [Mycena epipterygia]
MHAPEFGLFFLILCFTRTTFALSPNEIIYSLNSLTTKSNQTTILFNNILAHNGNETANVLASKNLLDETTAEYLAFSQRLATNPGDVVLDESISNSVLQAATLHSQMFSTMGIALADCLPIYNQYGFYLDGCADGVQIGVHAITLFANMGLKFPSKGVALILTGLATNLRVPLVQLSAIGCFVPFLGPLPVR